MKKFIILTIFVLALLALPFVLWIIEPAKSLDIAIIDKTVPDESYREHQGLTWMLNHFKYADSAEESYDAAEDFYGFYPDEDEEDYETVALPTDYTGYDVIYLADTYGVYEEDLPWADNLQEGTRSDKVYGGLEVAEWDNILERLKQPEKSLLVAEYNTFASPTNATVRQTVTNFLGLQWDGWTGRYFDELNPEKNEEIPQWILDEFQEAWQYEGEGFVLVNDINYQVLVLEAEHITDGGINVAFTEAGTEQFGLTESPAYEYWFDIVIPRGNSKVLATYDWSLSEAGEQLLEENNIPTEFAAVLSSTYGASQSYYFAGDYNDVANVPRLYQAKGLHEFYRIADMFSDNAFYWTTYVPMMENILETFSESEVAQEEVTSDGPGYNARVVDKQFEILQDDEWVPMTIKGVNIGMAKPGVFPGEAGITEDEYYEWFEQIREMNANTVRVYTIHPPGFYDALKRYNDAHDEKIYVMHGVWINEEKLEDSLDAFEEDNLNHFQQEMRDVVDVIHGNIVIPPEPGHASGVYRSDVSEYVSAWVLGIEWYPLMVLETNKKHAGMGDFDGDYFETKDAEPFEYWLAEQMELITAYEIDNYNWMRPMSFTNWVTTDILDHPADSSNQEDMVGVDPNVIFTKNDMQLTEQFASYHIYPYYPDFLNYDEDYINFVDHRGEKNNYAGYLADLHAVHRLPILVAEFGVPGSRGKTHENPFGKNQGFLSETEQGVIIKELFEDIMAANMMGGLIFTWQDEWFKRTWNTMDYDNPDRRPFWSNAQTNEEQFGLLSFDRHKIQVDGDVSEWETTPLYEKEHRILKDMHVDHDERYLYLRLDYDSETDGYPMIVLDTIPHQGNHFITDNDSVVFENGIDFLINLHENESRIIVDTYYDFYTYQYGILSDFIQPEPEVPVKNSGQFSPIFYTLNKEYFVPTTGETIPFQAYETGKLKAGNGNPASPDYNSLVDYHMSEDGVVEIRIPWMLIQLKDPSQKEIIGDIIEGGLEASEIIEAINLGALYLNTDDEVIDSLPAMESNTVPALESYTWNNWQLPLYEPRLKQSYYIMQDVFNEYK